MYRVDLLLYIIGKHNYILKCNFFDENEFNPVLQYYWWLL